ncbi:MAG: bile acid:sodium symporter [Planctomycetota bacterium]
MLQFIAKRWFLFSLTGLIALGMTLGGAQPGWVKPTADAMNPLLTTAAILFLMSFSLETRQLQAALRTPLPVFLGAVLNIGLAPLLGIALMAPQGLIDFRYGLLVASCVPCTMAAASVWTRKAHGNDAISLLVTLVTNSASILTIPFWLTLATTWFPLGSTEDASTLVVNAPLLNLRQTAIELLVGVLLPIILGQIVRQPAVLSAWALRHKVGISAVAQVQILIMVWTAAVKGGYRISQTNLVISLSSVVLVWASVIVVHLTTLYAGFYLCRILRVSRADQIAVAFAGSQKTLPVGLLISETLSRQAGLSFAVFPMLMYHASQLFLDTIIADRIVANEQAKKP